MTFTVNKTGLTYINKDGKQVYDSDVPFRVDGNKVTVTPKDGIKSMSSFSFTIGKEV